MIADVLDGAADLLEERGWCQNDYETPEGQMCLAAALTESALRYHQSWSVALAAAVEARGVVMKATRTRSVPAYNDADGRTLPEILTLVRGLAKDQRA